MSSSRTLSISSRKPPKCGADEEVAMDAGEIADRTAFDETPHAADARDEAAVLNDGVDLAGFGGEIDECGASASEVAIGFSLSTWQPALSAVDTTLKRAVGMTTSKTISALVSAMTSARSVPITSTAQAEFLGKLLGRRRIDVDEAR